jgi:zinc protease
VRVSVCKTVALAMALIVVAAGCATKTVASSAGSEPPPPVVETLPNGLTLVVQEHRAADIVAVHLWVATGVRFENPDGLGYAHFQEHMLFKGTDKFGPGYIDRAIEGTGGRSNAFTTYDYTTFQILVPSDAIKTAVDLLDEMAFRSKFDPKEINAEREVIFEETRIQTDNPRDAIVRRAYSAVFGEHPYGRPLLGTTETMNAATQKDLQAFNRRYYTPENMTLVVVGPVQAKAVRALVDQTFGQRPRTGYTAPANPPLKPITEIVRVKVERPEQQAYLVLAWQAPPLADPDAAALDLAATILGGSESSRLALTLRDTERLVSRVAMNNASQKLSGIVYIQVQLEAADVDKVEKRILEEIARLQKDGPTEEERELAVTKAESDHATSYETSDGVAGAYGITMIQANLDNELRYLDRLKAITRAQIQAAAQKYLSTTAYAWIAFVPRMAQ